jgi:hypothetical protein
LHRITPFLEVNTAKKKSVPSFVVINPLKFLRDLFQVHPEIIHEIQVLAVKTPESLHYLLPGKTRSRFLYFDHANTKFFYGNEGIDPDGF